MPTAAEIIDALRGEMFPSMTPFGKWLGGRVVDGGDGTLTLEFNAREDMANPIGILHGGIISAIIDEMVGFTVYAMLTTGMCKKFVMINSNVDFLAPIPIGEVIRATCDIIREGKIAVNVECRLVTSDGLLVAKGTVNVIKLSNI